MGLVKVDGVLGIQDGDVVAQSSRASNWVLEEPDHGVLVVVAGLGVEATGIVLTNTDLQQRSLAWTF